ncbi:MAG: acyl-CoA mutase large subunit family protein [Candidatus Krumholzibacteriota bacterium]|nr:acyl-CoA mutase large subunit family protein [Candidatus Krumholzibacteriota bacterium]
MPGKDPTAPPRATLSIHDDFPPADRETWRAEVERLLQGAPFEKRMLTKTLEGITLQPLYGAGDAADLPEADGLPGFPPFVRGGHAAAGWEIAQFLGYADPTAFNRELLHDLARGQSAVVLPLDRASRLALDPDQAAPDAVGVDGVSIASVADLDTALADVDLERVPVYLQSGASGMPYLALYVALARRRGVEPAALPGAVAMDPLGELASQGSLSQSLDWAFVSMAEMTAWAAEQAPMLGTMWCHGGPYRDGGASVTQELAFVLATAITYLREMEKRGLPPETVAPRIRFSFAQGDNLFMEIAKLRAARLLWNRVLEACGLPPELRRMWIHARGADYTKTLYDPYVNMLRTVAETFAGAVGGADSQHAAPFDAHLRPADEFSRRVARNTQLVLRDEALLGRVADPAGGSWFVERLTADVAEAAWALLGDVERRGGMVAALVQGFPQDQVTAVAAARDEVLASRRDVIVGTNKYPNPSETRLVLPRTDSSPFHARRAREVRALREPEARRRDLAALEQLGRRRDADARTIAQTVIEAAAQGATVGEIVAARCATDGEPPRVRLIPRWRAAEPFERLRGAVERRRAERGGCRVFLATLGSAGRIMARLDFAASFFAVGGFEVLRDEGHDTPAAAAAAAVSSGAEVVAVCGRDEDYAEGAPAVARAVKAGRPGAVVVLAGKPADDDQRRHLEQAGVDRCIHLQSDVLAELGDIAARLGVHS